MTKRVRQCMACFLALSFALAGLVAMIPALHLALEHGGQGEPHSHVGGSLMGTKRGASLGGVDRHLGDGRRAWGDASPHKNVSTLFVSTHGSFLFPEIPVRRWLHSLGCFLEQVTASRSKEPDDAPSTPNPGHEHHSFVQSIAAGLLELSLNHTLAPASRLEVPFVFRLSLPRLPTMPPDPRTAGRPPPAIWA